MKKIWFSSFIFIILSFATDAYSFMPRFYFDEQGQLRDNGNAAQQDCFRKRLYWNGKTCQKIIPVETCKAQGGEWYQVQMVVRNYMKYICLCPQDKFWDGKNCVNNLPQAKKCRIEVWCDSKMSDVIANVTPEIMDLTACTK